jgi:hypothetical protein
MNVVQKDKRSLKLFITEDKKVWFANSNGPPTDADCLIGEFMHRPLMLSARHIRLIGSAQNSKLIVQLYQKILNKELGKLEICSPMVCETVVERNDPTTALISMRNWNWPASLGGWHEVTADDYNTHLLIQELKVNKLKPVDTCLRILKNHLTWPTLEYVQNIDQHACALLLANIIDPRWFIDLSEPDSSSKLKAYLGLNPKTQGYVNGLSGYPHNINADRCRLVMKAWKTQNTEPKDIHHPRNFLWKTWVEHGRGATADLRTSQRFIAFLRHTWLNLIYDKKPFGEDLFLPEYFFKTKEEINFYKQYFNLK